MTTQENPETTTPPLQSIMLKKAVAPEEKPVEPSEEETAETAEASEPAAPATPAPSPKPVKLMENQELDHHGALKSKIGTAASKKQKQEEAAAKDFAHSALFISLYPILTVYITKQGAVERDAAGNITPVAFPCHFKNGFFRATEQWQIEGLREEAARNPSMFREETNKKAAAIMFEAQAARAQKNQRNTGMTHSTDGNTSAASAAEAQLRQMTETVYAAGANLDV